jgi:GntR family transcriptional regulator
LIRSGTPLYLQVKVILLEKIENGEWKPGTMIPTEMELMRTYSVSRTTVRQAIQDLVVSGKLTRHAGRGTFVARQERILSSSQLYGFVEDLERDGVNVNLTHTITTENLSTHAATQLELPVASEAVKIARIAYINDEPIFCDESFLPKNFESYFLEYAINPPYIYSLLEAKGVIIASGSQNIYAMIADEIKAAKLACSVGDPLLVIERTTRDIAGKPVEFSTVHYRADRYQYKIRLSRTTD